MCNVEYRTKCLGSEEKFAVRALTVWWVTLIRRMTFSDIAWRKARESTAKAFKVILDNASDSTARTSHRYTLSYKIKIAPVHTKTQFQNQGDAAWDVPEMLRCLPDVRVARGFTSSSCSYYKISAIKLKVNHVIIRFMTRVLPSNGSFRDVYYERGHITARGVSSPQEEAETTSAGTWERCMFCLVLWICCEIVA